MSSEFDKLMLLAEQHTKELQLKFQAKHSKPSHTSDNTRQHILEQRIRQQEQQRKRHQEEEEQQQQQQHVRQQQQAIEQRKRQRDLEQQHKKQPVVEKRKIQPMSFDQLMQVAEGRPLKGKQTEARMPEKKTLKVERPLPKVSRKERKKHSAVHAVASKMGRESRGWRKEKPVVHELDRFGVHKKKPLPVTRRPSAAVKRLAPVTKRSTEPSARPNISRQPLPPQARSKSRYEEEEEDSMDDFIEDDDDDDGYQAGSIRRMFGVRYREVDDGDVDVDDMEASASRMMMEDRRSARIGRMEDIEEERRQMQEERRRRRP